MHSSIAFLLRALRVSVVNPSSVAAGIILTLAGCTIHPAGERDERNTATQLGKPFEKRIEAREVQPLPTDPTQDQIVEFALLNNADLEQKYWAWRAAIEQIPQDGTQSTSLNIAGGTTITKGHTSWSSSTVTLGNDPMTDIKWPGKLDAAARQSLENARAAGRRFRKAQFDLRNRVLTTYYDYALTAELIRLAQANQQLLEITASTTAARNRVGSAGQEDVLKAGDEVDMSENEIASMKAQLSGQRAMLNALMGRAADAPLPAPSELPPTRSLAFADSDLIRLAVNNNPELVALSDETHGRQQAVRLAKLQWVPDFNFSAGTDLEGIAQSIIGQATIPIFRYEAINASIAQAEANLRASEAAEHQSAEDLSAQVVTDITTLRDADRQINLLTQKILPHQKQVVELERSSYQTGRATLLDLLESQRSLVATQRLLANVRILREKNLIDLEAITTIDLCQIHGREKTQKAQKAGP